MYLDFLLVYYRAKYPYVERLNSQEKGGLIA